MRIEQLIEELYLYDPEAEAEVEFNNTLYAVQAVTEDSQGVYLQIDTCLSHLEFRQ